MLCGKLPHLILFYELRLFYILSTTIVEKEAYSDRVLQQHYSN